MRMSWVWLQSIQKTHKNERCVPPLVSISQCPPPPFLQHNECFLSMCFFYYSFFLPMSFQFKKWTHFPPSLFFFVSSHGAEKRKKSEWVNIAYERNVSLHSEWVPLLFSAHHWRLYPFFCQNAIVFVSHSFVHCYPTIFGGVGNPEKEVFKKIAGWKLTQNLWKTKNFAYLSQAKWKNTNLAYPPANLWERKSLHLHVPSFCGPKILKMSNKKLMANSAPLPTQQRMA